MEILESTDCGKHDVKNIKFSRVWAMPNSDTFKVKPIGEFVKKYLDKSKVSVDSFARNNSWCSYTNDINPTTIAQYHLDAEAFHLELVKKEIKCDLWVFDPPYSPRQLKECYNSFGRKMQLEDGQTARLRKIWKATMVPVLALDAVVLSFGWNTVGMGKKLGLSTDGLNVTILTKF